MLYFLAVGEPPAAIKIGVAAQTGSRSLADVVKRRLDHIQSSNHEPIQLLGLIHFDHSTDPYPMHRADAMERELHLEFQSLGRFAPGTRGSEWFNVSDRLLERIQALSVPPEALGIARRFCTPIG